MVITERQLELVENLAKVRVQAEKSLGVEAPSECPMDDEDAHDVAFRVTGIKYDYDHEDVEILRNAYTDAYYAEYAEYED